MNWTRDVEHMGHPTAYTNTTPKGYKEDISWHDVDVDYTEEEKAKIRKENYEKGGKMATKSVHDKEVTDHPKPKPGPPQFKNTIKKCATKGCDLSEEELREKLKDKPKKNSTAQISEPGQPAVMLFDHDNQDKLFEFINSPQINSLAFRGHKDATPNSGNPIYPAKDSQSEILPYNQRDHAWTEA